MPSGLKVIIAGGGIGGLCLAQALHRAGIRVAVYERDRDPDARPDRYRLHINPAGARSLRACLPPDGWTEFLATAGVTGGGFGFLTHQLQNLVEVDDTLMYPPSTDPAERWYPVDRAALRRLLLTGLDGIVHFDSPVVRYELAPDGRVVAQLGDGRTATGDVLVGADGTGSQVARQYLPHARLIDTGAVGVGLKLPLTADTRAWVPPRLLAGENLILSPASSFLFTSVFQHQRTPVPAGRVAAVPESDYLLCAFVARKEARPVDLSRTSGAALQRVLEAMVADWHPDLRRLLAECDPHSVASYPLLATAPVPPWQATRVVLLGDAIHSMPPTGGLGANTALRDARLLARQLTGAARGETPLLAAIAAYEAEMRRYGFAAVRSSVATLHRGLTSNVGAYEGMRLWFRLTDAVPALKRLTFRNNWAEDARRRPWESA